MYVLPKSPGCINAIPKVNQDGKDYKYPKNEGNPHVLIDVGNADTTRHRFNKIVYNCRLMLDVIDWLQ